jgi:uncharacterized protein
VAKTPQKTQAASDKRRIQTRRSGVHGKGVFALVDIAEGETIIEYVGEVISWKEAQRRHPHARAIRTTPSTFTLTKTM